MRPIVAGIHTLIQYLKIIEEDPEQLRPAQCPHCGKESPNCHGHYERKADREQSGQASLNPIIIFRFYCTACKKTCSVLPECIPPRRWYLWSIQQSVLHLIFFGASHRKASKQSLPSRQTISRWCWWLADNFKLFGMHLKSRFSRLGYCHELFDFWRSCLSDLKLSYVMLFLNNSGVVVP